MHSAVCKHSVRKRLFLFAADDKPCRIVVNCYKTLCTLLFKEALILKSLRMLSALLACLMLLSLSACAPRATTAEGDRVIDVAGPDETAGVADAAPTVSPSSTLDPLILGMPSGANPTVPMPTETPAGASAEQTPAQTPVPAETESPAETETPAETPAASATPIPSSGDDLPYYLYVEKGSFTLTIYQKGADGTYSDVYKTYRIAHGGNKTPAGTFTLGGDRERWHEFPDGGFVQFATRYHNRLYLHSPLYGEEDNGYMWPKYYDGELGIGKESTGGCLRMVTEAARFIYENCPEGTVLEIVNGSPKGTTSDDIPSRNGKRYDPTDIEAGD